MSRWFNHGNVQSTQGLPAEQLFGLLAVREGWNVLAADLNQDRREHWDFCLSRDGAQFKVDVKSRKRISRQDSAMSDDLVWIEFKNGAGQPGWLYGRADLIAFECEDYFLICRRLALLEHSLRVVDQSAQAMFASDALKKVYTRKDRQDQLSLLPTTDLLSTAILWGVWMKCG